MEAIKLSEQEHTYSNGAGVQCRYGIEVRRTENPTFIEISRVRSDGRRISRILLTEREAVDLRDALGSVLGPEESPVYRRKP